jgi:hypothetical protein
VPLRAQKCSEPAPPLGARARKTVSCQLSAVSFSPTHFVAGMHIIIGMPPHIIIIGAPMAIIEVMASQRSFMRAIIAGSVGVIFMTMPSFVISQDILHIIGIMPLIIIGIIMPMPGIMPFIIGIMPFIIGIMPFIIGIMPFIIGMAFWLFIMPIGIIGIWFMAFMVSSIDSSADRGRSRSMGRNLVRGATYRPASRVFAEAFPLS